MNCELRQKSARAAWSFAATTCALSWAFLWLVKSGRLVIPELAFAYLLMWIPGATAICLRLVTRQGFADAGLCAGQPKWWARSYLIPLGMGALTYGMAYALGQVELAPHLKEQSMYGPVPLKLKWPNAEWSATTLLAIRLAIVSTIGISVGYAAALGEEIGWRGFLLPKLIESGQRFPILISGMVWGVWHVPFVLMFYSRHQVMSAALYFMACVASAPFIAWVRLGSGSVLVAAMAHAAYNSFYQEFFDHSFAGEEKWFWAGDVGVWCIISFGMVALWLYRNKWQLLISAASKP